MLAGIAFTLYEILGYMLPGSIALNAVVILFWSIFLPDTPFAINKINADPVGWVAFAVVSYMMGHAVQAVANWWCKGAEEAVLGPNGKAPAKVVEYAKKKASSVLGVAPPDIDSVWLFKIMDEARVQGGILGDRDMFVYREGFYKASSTAFVFLAAALIARTMAAGAAIRFCTFVHPVSRWEVATGSLFVALLSYLMARRARRFGEYRVSYSLTGFLVQQENKAKVASVGPGTEK